MVTVAAGGDVSEKGDKVIPTTNNGTDKLPCRRNPVPVCALQRGLKAHCPDGQDTATPQWASLVYYVPKGDDPMGVPELLLLAVMCFSGGIGGHLAGLKGRNQVGWFLLCAFVWLAIFIVLYLPPIKEVPGKYRQCPSCKELVKWYANLCKHCGTAVAPR